MDPVVWPLAEDWPTPALDGLDPKTAGVLASAAADYLWAWTGGVFGLRSGTVRPCWGPVPAPLPWQAPSYRWGPVMLGGARWALACGCGRGPCSCGLSPARLRFPFRVDEVTEVRVAGAVFTDWRLENHSALVRTDGAGWPAAQVLELADGEPGTWEVDLIYGAPVPDGGKIAAAVLANEMGKAVSGDSSCELPQRIQTITRQGVTIGMLDPMDGLDDGKTGLWLVDSWVASVTKTNPRTPATSPDTPKLRWTT